MFVSGRDRRLLFGRRIGELVADVDSGCINFQSAIPFGLRDSTADAMVYEDFLDGAAWTIEQVWFSTGANVETAGRYCANSEGYTVFCSINLYTMNLCGVTTSEDL